MLVVTDNGVKIQLADAPSSAHKVMPILITSALLVLLGVAIAIGLPVEIAIGVAILIIAGGFLWQKFGQKSTPTKTIAGGEITITPAQIEHISPSGQRMVYPLPQHIDFTQSDNQLFITDKSAQPLLTISGFSQPQHLTIAQAVLQGKSIKTQGKAIRMQG